MSPSLCFKISYRKNPHPNEISRMPFLVIRPALLFLLLGGLNSVTLAADTPPELSAGQKIYNYRCYFCHGYAGDAKTVAASFLTPPPVDFTRADAKIFTPQHIVATLQKGKPGTAMKSFQGILTEQEMMQVANFVVTVFVQRSKNLTNTYYHTPANGWPNHQQYADAFPFATGKIFLSQPIETLTAAQVRGRELFLSSCVICHSKADGPLSDNPVIWEARPLSFPRNHFDHSVQPAPSTPLKLDAMSSASPYLLHDIPPKIENLSAIGLHGQKLFQNNCAFCHAADGTGKNWIGSFLQPHPRNLRDANFMKGMTRDKLAATIREGIPETSMPAWKSVLSEAEITAIIEYVSIAFHPLP